MKKRGRTHLICLALALLLTAAACEAQEPTPLPPDHPARQTATLVPTEAPPPDDVPEPARALTAFQEPNAFDAGASVRRLRSRRGDGATLTDLFCFDGAGALVSIKRLYVYPTEAEAEAQDSARRADDGTAEVVRAGSRILAILTDPAVQTWADGASAAQISARLDAMGAGAAEPAVTAETAYASDAYTPTPDDEAAGFLPDTEWVVYRTDASEEGVERIRMLCFDALGCVESIRVKETYRDPAAVDRLEAVGQFEGAAGYVRAGGTVYYQSLPEAVFVLTPGETYRWLEGQAAEPARLEPVQVALDQILYDKSSIAVRATGFTASEADGTITCSLDLMIKNKTTRAFLFRPWTMAVNGWLFTVPVTETVTFPRESEQPLTVTATVSAAEWYGTMGEGALYTVSATLEMNQSASRPLVLDAAVVRENAPAYAPRGTVLDDDGALSIRLLSLQGENGVRIVAENRSQAAILCTTALLAGDDVFLPGSTVRLPAGTRSIVDCTASPAALSAFGIGAPETLRLCVGVDKAALKTLAIPQDSLPDVLAPTVAAPTVTPLYESKLARIGLVAVDRSGSDPALVLCVENLSSERYLCVAPNKSALYFGSKRVNAPFTSDPQPPQTRMLFRIPVVSELMASAESLRVAFDIFHVQTEGRTIRQATTNRLTVPLQ